MDAFQLAPAGNDLKGGNEMHVFMADKTGELAWGCALADPWSPYLRLLRGILWVEGYEVGFACLGRRGMSWCIRSL